MEIVRGDTKTFKIQRRTKSGEVIMEKPEKMYMTFKYGQEKEPVFQKRLGDGIIFDEATGFYQVTIEPKDTNNLPFITLNYDIEIINGDNVKTIKIDKLEIKEEYTFACNEV